MLGGKLDPGKDKDNGVPGPGKYEPEPNYHLPGFVIVNPKRSGTGKQEPLKEHPIGPQKYTPAHPGETFAGQAYPGQTPEDAMNPAKKGSFGNAMRDGHGAVIEDENIRKHR